MRQFCAKGGGGGGGGGLVSHRGLNALEMERRKVEKIKKRHQKKKTSAEQQEHRGKCKTRANSKYFKYGFSPERALAHFHQLQA